MPYAGSLPLNERNIKRCRQIAKTIAADVAELVHQNSTVGTERAVLRLLGFNDAMEHEGLLYPVANLMVDQLKETGKIHSGALYWVANGILETGHSIRELEAGIKSLDLNLAQINEGPRPKVVALAKKLAREAYASLMLCRKNRKALLKKSPDPLREKRPLKYVIVATGNIFEDVTQAKSAVLDGADIIAVIRSTAQSLIDYVPHGTTTTGFGGTYATQANFHLMREALDTLGTEVGRYIRLTNYCSGLCMSEIAALAGLEGLDCLLNDAMYGILFRDINMRRTLIDQHFSRLICSVSGIWIMTGEDNYMKTTDATKESDQVLASQFINEATAWNAGVPYSQMAIGHAMEMNPDYEKVILMELARAKMTRQIFPEAPLKYMCPTKYMTGDVFTGHAYNVIFDLIGSLTEQGTLLLGMPTEAIHTPFLSDRSLSLRAANYILKGTSGGASEIGYRTDGFMAKFSNEVLEQALTLLEKISKIGILKAIEKRYFAGVCRLENSGKGADGVFPIDRSHYLNPFFELMGSRI